MMRQEYADAPFPARCGRLDKHDAHDWSRRLPDRSTRHYTCTGHIVIEGGYFADLLAKDDAAEEREMRDAREVA